jgi:site-specific recombinase XerD
VKSLLAAVSCPRSRAALLVAFGAGLRISELRRLQIRDVQPERDAAGRKLDRGVLVVRHGKGDKDRLAPLSPTLLTALREYFVTCRPKGPWLFPSPRGDAPIQADSLRKALRAATRKAGLPHSITPHSLRHAFATAMLDRSVDLPTLQVALGHASIKTTVLYLHVHRQRLAAMPDALAPSPT